MNIKHIFVFTICVVLPNGLYSTDEKNIQVNRQALKNHWMPQNKKDTGFQVDGEGNVLLHILTQNGAKKNKIFVKNKLRAIGVNLATALNFYEGEDNDEVIDYFSKIFEVPEDALEIVSGLKSKRKILKVKRGFLPMEAALEKVVNEYMAKRNS